MTDQEFSDFVISKTVKRIEFEASQVPLFGKPIVYMALGKNVVLYVGMSKHGIGRVFCRDHHALTKVQSDIISLEVYETKTVADAIALEDAMIKEFKPLYNERKYIPAIRNKYGRSTVAAVIDQMG